LILFSTVFLSTATADAQAPGGQPRAVVSEADRLKARTELDAGTRAYRERDFARAQMHFERSRDADPGQPAVRLLIARAIHAQHRENADSPGKTAKARQAIAAYREALRSEPANEEAYQAVLSLYEVIGDEEAQRDWILGRAGEASTSARKRSEAYTFLARKDERCARAVTERSDGGLKAESATKAATRCAERGLKFAEQALALDRENELAWSVKVQLLSALAKLAEAEGRSDQQARYERQAEEARNRANEVSEKARQKSEARSY